MSFLKAPVFSNGDHKTNNQEICSLKLFAEMSAIKRIAMYSQQN